jgi:hypothetical protein
MRFTNKLNLPQYLVDWLENDNYDYIHAPNTVSATTLLKPLRAHIITSRHGEDLEVDVSELVASRYGNAIHDSVERIETPGVTKEQRVSRKVTIGDTEYTVTGKYDVLVEKDGVYTIRDMKSTSAWTFIYGGKDEDYRAQLSIYRWLLSQDKQVEPVAFIDFFFTDWQGIKARTEKGYPQSRIHAGYRIELLSLEETEAFIRSRLSALHLHRDLPEEQLPECTEEELWAEKDTYAVYKIGNKRATKVCDTKEEAIQYKDSHKLNGFVQERKGKVKRCKYCSAAPFCSQFKELQAKGLVAE